jgi:hypothetical protein
MLAIGNVAGSGNSMNTHQTYQKVKAQWQPVMYNPVITYPMSQPTSGQQVPTNDVIAPMQHHMIPPIHNYPSEDYTSQQSQRMTSTNEEEEETQNNSKNEWQVIISTKRKKIHRTQHNTPETKMEIHNRYGLLANETNEDSIDGNPSSKKIHKPPPIFVHGVIKYGEIIKRIKDIPEDEQNYTKSMENSVIKINCVTPETYRKLVKYFKENNIFRHTYQLKEERAYRTVIKYLHHSTDTEDIRQELCEIRHNVRNITNAQHRTIKEPLKLLFVGLEPAENNKEIYKIKALQNKIIQIEPPRVKKNNII